MITGKDKMQEGTFEFTTRVKDSATPWKVDPYFTAKGEARILDKFQTGVALVFNHTDNRSDAIPSERSALIVRAVNRDHAFDALVTALKDAITKLERLDHRLLNGQENPVELREVVQGKKALALAGEKGGM